MPPGRAVCSLDRQTDRIMVSSVCLSSLISRVCLWDCGRDIRLLGFTTIYLSYLSVADSVLPLCPLINVLERAAA